MTRMVRARAALLVILALLMSGCDFSVYKLPLPGGADTGEDPMQVTVRFPDVLDLVPQSTVKVNDVTVGKVTDVKLDGYQAVVTLELRKDVKLADNATAEIRQTSLLGEKFVSLEKPADPSPNLLGDGDKIDVDATNRNPEVEEVLGALSLLLNGGGVGQLKTITVELNKALGGNETEVNAVLHKVERFMGQLALNKQDIVDAITSLNRLAKTANRHKSDLTGALDDLPSALDSVNSQRRDLVKMLRALSRLSKVGTRVISKSKNVTINALTNLDPVLTKLADSGDDLVKSFHVILTYPFVDEAVGRDPQVAKNLHMGDYTNLSIKLDVDVGSPIPGGPTIPVDPEVVCITLDQVEDRLENLAPDERVERLIKLIDSGRLCKGALDTLNTCLNGDNPLNCLGDLGDFLLDNCPDDPLGLVKDLCDTLRGEGGSGGGGGGGGDPLDDLLGGLGDGVGNGLGLNPRTAPQLDPTRKRITLDELSRVYDPVLVGVLMPGVAQ